MKKLTMALVAIALVLCMGQVVMAKVDITAGVKAGYEHRLYGDGDIKTHEISAVSLGLSGNVYLINRLSLALEGDVLFGKWIYSSHPTDSSMKSWVNIGLYARYDVLVGDKYKLGVQAGASYDVLNLTVNGLRYYNYTAVFIVPGLFGAVELLPKLKLSADVKIPIGTWYEGSYSPGKKSFFFKFFLYDTKLALTYEVMPNINVGVEAQISNMNAHGVLWLWEEMSYDEYFTRPAWNVSLKLEYKF